MTPFKLVCTPSAPEFQASTKSTKTNFLGPEIAGWHGGQSFLPHEGAGVARLQSEFCSKDFFRATNFLMKNAPKFSPKFLSLSSVGLKESRKIPSKFPTKFPKFPLRKMKKIHRRASAGAQGERRGGGRKVRSLHDEGKEIERGGQTVKN